DAILRPIRNRHDPRLVWPEIDLKCQLVSLSVAVQIVDLRRELRGLQRCGIFIDCGCVRCGVNHRAWSEVWRDASDLRDRNDHIGCRSRLRTRIVNGKFDALNALMSPEGLSEDAAKRGNNKP